MAAVEYFDGYNFTGYIASIYDAETKQPIIGSYIFFAYSFIDNGKRWLKIAIQTVDRLFLVTFRMGLILK